LLSENGKSEILEQVAATGVQVKTICADYFMEAPLHSADIQVAAKSLSVLKRLLVRAAEVGGTDVVIPCVDHASLRDSQMVDNFVNAVKPLLGMLDELNINLSLETDLNPSDFTALLQRFDSPRITVNYDTGNSAALGYDPVEELAAYGDKITDIHIKDRVLGGGSVVLGTGSTEFERFFEKLKELTGLEVPEKYKGSRGRLIDSMVDGHKYIFGKRAVIYGEEDLVIGLTAFLAEIGIHPVLCASGGKSGRFKEGVQAALQGVGCKLPLVKEDVDFYDIEAMARELGVDLVVGHSKGYAFARRENLPMIRAGFPIHDRIGGQRILHLGYEGAQSLFDLITNTIIDRKQSDSPVGYSYM